jgi:hypothetical protein
MNNTLLDKTEFEVFQEKRTQVHTENKSSMTEVYNRLIMLIAFVEFHGLEHNFKEFQEEVKKG